MQQIESRLGSWVIALRWPIIIASLILVGIAASGTLFLEFSADHRAYFSEDNPELVALESLENTYGTGGNVLFAIVPEDRDATSSLALEATAWLTERAWQIPYSTRVDSITNFQHMTAVGDDLVVEDLVDDAGRGDVNERARIRAIALGEPRLAARLIARDGAVSGINVVVQLPGENEAIEGPQVAGFARNLAREFRERFPGIDVRLTGLVIFNQTFMEVTLKDLKTLVPACFVVMVLVLALLTRGFSGTFTTMLVVAMAVITAVGTGGWIGLPMTSAAAVAPVVVLTVTMANCVHIYSTLVHDMQASASRILADRGSGALLQRTRSGALKRDSIVESLRVNLHPVFLASLTTALGFLSMNFSEVPPFRHLGTFVAIGVGAAFVLSVTVLPALLSLLPIRVRATGHRHDAAMVALGEFVVRRRRPLLWSAGLTAVALVASIPRNELNDVFLNYFHESIEFRRDADFTAENLTGMYAMEYSLSSGEPGGISDPDFLSDVAAFAEWYRRQPEAIHVNVITDMFRQLNMSMHGDDTAEYRLPASRALAAQYLLVYEMSLPYGLDLNNQIDVDKSATRMTVTTQTLSSNEVLALDTRALQWLSDNAPDIAVAESSGTTLIFASLGRRNIISMLVATTAVLVGISFVLVFALRSLRLGLTSLVPNLVPGGARVRRLGVDRGRGGTLPLGGHDHDARHRGRRYRALPQQVPEGPARARLHVSRRGAHRVSHRGPRPAHDIAGARGGLHRGEPLELRAQRRDGQADRHRHRARAPRRLLPPAPAAHEGRR